MRELPQIICLMDVLGFENALRSLGLQALRSQYDRLIEFVRKQEDLGLGILDMPDGSNVVGRPRADSAYFSDTVIFWTGYDSLNLRVFSILMADMICFGLESAIPLRGAISAGELDMDKATGTYLGEPLVEAARTEPQQNWLGISFGPSFNAPPFNEQLFLHTLLPFKSHYKDATNPYATGLVIDWPRRWRETRSSDVRSFVHALDSDLQFSHYYDNTLAFVEFSEENHDWFKKQTSLDFG